jgi:hypothetical protein
MSGKAHSRARKRVRMMAGSFEYYFKMNRLERKKAAHKLVKEMKPSELLKTF